ncbi:MAG: hypothetical protein JW871_02220 [Endomicrobiales bacterium]|nr:hypothetical protein [Endomicrobiales bacterium]
MVIEIKKPGFLKKAVISIALTILLGPGVGHLYLRYFKQGILLIIATLFFALHQALKVVASVPKEELSNITQQEISYLFQKFAVEFPRTIFLYDIIFAAIWAYALVDVFNKSRK